MSCRPMNGRLRIIHGVALSRRSKARSPRSWPAKPASKLDLSETQMTFSLDFIAKPRSPSGYTWTLATIMGEFLYRAETLYGARDTTWTPLGIEFEAGGPRVWYPGYPDNRYVVIQLSLGARENRHVAIFELAHEVIH